MTVRYPRPFVTINGVDIPTIEMRVLRSAERSADRFGVTIAASAALARGLTLNDFADWQPQDVSVSLSLDLPANPAVLMVGRVDDPAILWKDFKITLDGRDKSTLLIDKVRSENFQNSFTKYIVEKIAKDHGLKSRVQSKASFAGKKYTDDNNHLALGKTDYDIMNDLAAREGCRWYVDGNDLYLEPRDDDSSPFDVYWYPPGTVEAYAVANVTHLETARNMTAARPLRVRGRSWHTYEARQYEAKAEMGGVGEPVEYVYDHNGKQYADIQGLVDGRIKDHARHDMRVTVRMPVDLSVTPRRRMRLHGTGTVYDQTFDIDAVEITCGYDEPAEMTLHCKSAKEGRRTGQGTSGTGNPDKQAEPGARSQPAAQAAYPPGGA